jgi:acyl-CoA thioesterase-2
VTAEPSLSFEDAVSVVALGAGRFSARYVGWSEYHRIFGGIVLAQSIVAAAATVSEPKVPNSMHGYFLRPSPPGAEVEITVESVRDGRSFSTREVRSIVEGKETSRFLISFHVPEPGRDYQLTMPEVPDAGSLEAKPGYPFEVIELGASEADSAGTYAWTRRCWLRCTAPIEATSSLHAAAMAYATDMTVTAYLPGFDGVGEADGGGSLDHAAWFHRPSDLSAWHLFDLRCVSVSNATSTIQGLLYAADGTLCASMAQELLARPGGARGTAT